MCGKWSNPSIGNIDKAVRVFLADQAVFGRTEKKIEGQI